MTFNLTSPVTDPQNIWHIDIARRVLARSEQRYALSPSEPASSGHPGHAAPSDAPPPLGGGERARLAALRARIAAARSAALAEPTYEISERELDELRRAQHELSELIAPLAGRDPERYGRGCKVVARLDRVIRHAQEQGAGRDGDATSAEFVRVAHVATCCVPWSRDHEAAVNKRLAGLSGAAVVVDVGHSATMVETVDGTQYLFNTLITYRNGGEDERA
jgi:hypothetical protein